MQVVEHCWIPLTDGIRLSARLWLPALPGNAPAPAILEYIPYRKRDMVRERDERNHPYFAHHGYACVRVDMRGSGDSEGLMTDMYSRKELDDAVEVIAWIADRPWCNGSVGMMGTSWGGTASLQAAARRPESLKAIIAVCSTNNRFDDDIHHMGGCLLTDTVEWGATLPVILASPPDPKTVGPAWRDQWRQRLEGLGFPLENWVRHEIRDEYWKWGAVDETPDAVVCPVLAIGGWADRYSNTVMNLLARSHDRCWGIVGPWGHHYPDVGCPGPGIDFQQEALRWWDHWLKGVGNGVDEAPRLRVWLQEYVEPENRVEYRPGRWVSEASWPSGKIRPTDFQLNAGRLQKNSERDDETLEVPGTFRVSFSAGDSGYFGRDGGLPLDQQEEDADSLVFESDALEEPLEILGAVRLTLPLRKSQQVATLVARLNDVPPLGGVARVAYAVRNLALDENGARFDECASGESCSYIIIFPNTAYRFETGHRIRLALSQSYWPLIWPPPRHGSICLRTGDARLTLPVRSAGVEAGEVVGLADPIQRINPDIEVTAAPVLERWTDIENTRRSIGWRQPFRCVRLKTINLDFGFETRARHSVDPNDPLSATSHFEHRLSYQRENWCVDIAGRAELTSTEKTFELDGSIEVRENEQLIFCRKWNPSVPRGTS